MAIKAMQKKGSRLAWEVCKRRARNGKEKKERAEILEGADFFCMASWALGIERREEETKLVFSFLKKEGRKA